MERKKRKTGSLKVNELLDVKNLKVNYYKNQEEFQAVKGISFQIKRNKTLGLVGESGCGKTTTGLAIARLIPTATGAVFFKGKNLLEMSPREFKPYRKKIQIIFQDPYSSLNPRLSLRKSLSEALELSHPEDKKQWPQIMAHKMEQVGLVPEYLDRFPHEFSGGQLQRLGIARALCVEPELIICDEPVSSLDVSIQAQILNLLMDLQGQLGLSYLFISHDLSVVKHISDEVAVMSKGCIREIGTVENVFGNPQSTYTKTLLESIPGQGKSALAV